MSLLSSFGQIRDGQEDDSPLIGDRLCGQNVQPNGVFFTSTDRYLLIRFVSDSSIADAGFQASYVVNGEFPWDRYRMR